MTSVEAIDSICDFCRKKICADVKLKYPRQVNDSGYEYELVTPSVHGMFAPPSKSPKSGAAVEIPSMTVQLLSGDDFPLKKETRLEFQILFVTWSPGMHGKDIFKQDETNPLLFLQWNNQEAKNYYDRAENGWRDVWNWIDKARREFGNAGSIAGMEIDPDGAGIHFEPIKEQDSLPDFYPFWMARLTFSAEAKLLRSVENVAEFL